MNLYTYDLKAYFASFTSNKSADKYQKYTLRCIQLFLSSPDVSYTTREGTITGSLAVVVFHNWLNHRLYKSVLREKSSFSRFALVLAALSLIKVDLWAIVDSITDALVQ